MVYEWSRSLRNFIYLNVSNRTSLVGTRGIHLSLNSLQPFIYQLLISLLFYNKVDVKLFPAFFLVLGQALSLANCIAKFPQASLLADRAQVHELTFNPHESELGSIHEEYVKNSELAYRVSFQLFTLCGFFFHAIFL